MPRHLNPSEIGDRAITTDSGEFTVIAVGKGRRLLASNRGANAFSDMRALLFGDWRYAWEHFAICIGAGCGIADNKDRIPFGRTKIVTDRDATRAIGRNLKPFCGT
jgi:hypothetical protein